MSAAEVIRTRFGATEVIRRAPAETVDEILARFRRMFATETEPLIARKHELLRQVAEIDRVLGIVGKAAPYERPAHPQPREDEPLPFEVDVKVKRRAGAKPKDGVSQSRKVLDFLANGPATSAAIANATGIMPHVLSTVLWQLTNRRKLITGEVIPGTGPIAKRWRLL